MAQASSVPENQPAAAGSSNPQAAVRIHLKKILNSTGFAGAERLRRFLEFAVMKTLEGQADQLKELVIGVEIFEKPNFDPKFDTTVRRAASRLRTKLREYYEGPGEDDSLRIDLPKGHYVPQFVSWTKPVEEEFNQGPDQRWRRSTTARVLCVMVLVTGVALIAWLLRGGPTVDKVPQVRLGRLLAKATSEGGVPKVIRLDYAAERLAASPDEQRVYAASQWSRRLTVISTKDDTLTRISHQICLSGRVVRAIG